MPVSALVHDTESPILVAHPFHEEEMYADLVSQGIDPSRLHRLYLDPDYIDMSRRSLPDYGGPVQALILGSTRYVTVSDRELARVLDPATTPYLAFDLFEASEHT